MGFDIKEDGSATKNSLATSASSPKKEDGGGGGDNLNNRMNNNSTSTPKDKEEQTITINVRGLDQCGDGPDLGEKDKLVLDVLNDEEVERVREKILSGNKDLFETCQIAVKAFIAGEPFQEFEHSMYFHR